MYVCINIYIYIIGYQNFQSFTVQYFDHLLKDLNDATHGTKLNSPA